MAIANRRMIMALTNKYDAARKHNKTPGRLSEQPWNKDRGGDLLTLPPLGWVTPDGKTVA
jgi:hypothetical protein